MLELLDFEVRRPGGFTVGPLNLQVRSGQISALIGPNGAGKSSLLAGLLGLLPVAQGEARLLGSRPADGQVRQLLGVVWQDGGLPLAVPSRRWLAHLARLYDTPVNLALLDRLALTPSRKPLRAHSGGERQRWALYSALAHQPLLLVLDEPTNGLDDAGRAVFYDLVRAHQQRGGGVLLTSHLSADVAVLGAEVHELGRNGNKGVAFFATDRPLDLSQLPEVLQVSNGYVLLQTTGEPLARIRHITATQGAQVVSYVRH